MAHRVRKTVTVFFADLVGSTTLGERLDPEVLEGIKARYFEESRTAIEQRGGTVEKFVGDAVMAVFGIPLAHEDDALRAAQAADAIRNALAPLRDELGVDLQARIGIDTGEVLTGDPADGEGFATGDTVNVAARLEQSAAPGEILLGPGTHARMSWAARCDPVGPLELKGKETAVRAWRLQEVRPDAEPMPRRLDAPLFGRERELAALEAAFGEATAEPGLRLVTLVGEAGIGKSRLAEELVRRLRAEATVLTGRCMSYGEGITYWPLAEIVREAAHHEARAAIVELFEGQPQSEFIATRLAAIVSASDVSTSSDEIAWAARKLFERLARDRPLVVRLEDVQWGAPTFLDLVEHVAYLSRGTPILLLCAARPELVDARPGWPGTRVHVNRLSPEESEALAIWHLTERDDAGLVERVVERGEGNPLFVEQLAAVLAEGGPPDAVPPTVEGLLAARLDLLEPRSRELLQRASVIGLEFSSAGLRHLDPGVDVGPAVLDLLRHGLVEPDETAPDGADGFRFAHQLVRDVTYAGTPKRQRAELHERLADWIESGGVDEVAVHELAAYHLEQAYWYRLELAERGEALDALGERAGVHLVAAARRAERDLGDIRSASGLLRRAVSVIADSSPHQVKAKVALANLLFESAELDEAEQLAEEAASRAAQEEDAAGECAALMLRERIVAAHTGDFSRLAAAAERAVTVFTDAGDDDGLARAWLVLGLNLDASGEAPAARHAAEQALEAARRAGDIRLEGGARAQLWRGLYYGPTPADEVMRNTEELTAWARGTGSLGLERRMSFFLARSYALVGRLDEARELLAQSRAVAEDLGEGFAVASSDWAAGEVAVLEGDKAGAVSAFTVALGFFQLVDDKSYIATVAAELAHALLDVGDVDGALERAALSRATADEVDLTAQVPWRTARARALARRGEFAEAEQLVAEARALAPADAHVLEHEAEVLRLAGRPQEAEQLLARALSAYEAKGNVPAAARVRALLLP